MWVQVIKVPIRRQDRRFSHPRRRRNPDVVLAHDAPVSAAVIINFNIGGEHVFVNPSLGLKLLCLRPQLLLAALAAEITF